MTLVLYYRPFCAYSRRVMNFAEEHGIPLSLRNIHEHPDIRNELIKIGGKAQIPCLVIDGKALYESNDILAWMEKNLEEIKRS